MAKLGGLKMNNKNLELEQFNIYDLDCSVRLFNVLVRGLAYGRNPAEITIKRLSELSYNDYLKFRGMGPLAMRELSEKLSGFGVEIEGYYERPKPVNKDNMKHFEEFIKKGIEEAKKHTIPGFENEPLKMLTYTLAMIKVYTGTKFGTAEFERQKGMPYTWTPLLAAENYYKEAIEND